MVCFGADPVSDLWVLSVEHVLPTSLQSLKTGRSQYLTLYKGIGNIDLRVFFVVVLT